MGGFYFLKQEEKEEHMLRANGGNGSLLETTRLQENLGKSAIYIFIENLLLVLGDCANQVFFFLFLSAPLSHNFTWGLSFNIHLLYQESLPLEEFGPSWNISMLTFCPSFLLVKCH